MKNSFNVEKERLTPEGVLEIFRDSHFQQCQWDPEAEWDIELTFDSSIDHWREACDLVSWKPLGRALNEWFGTQCLDDVWHQVLEPSNNRTLRGVCELIASQGQKISLKPINILGASCGTAGAFITIRAALKAAGVPVENLKPSTLLGSLLIKHWGAFIYEIGKIAPGALPPVEIKDSLITKLGHGFLLLGLLVMIIDVFIGNSIATLIAIIFLGLGVFSVVIGSYRDPECVSFENLITFGDLCSHVYDYYAKNRAA